MNDLSLMGLVGGGIILIVLIGVILIERDMKKERENE